MWQFIILFDCKNLDIKSILLIYRHLGLLLLLMEMELAKLWLKKLHGVLAKKDVGVSNGPRKVTMSITKMQMRSDHR